MPRREWKRMSRNRDGKPIITNGVFYFKGDVSFFLSVFNNYLIFFFTYTFNRYTLSVTASINGEKTTGKTVITVNPDVIAVPNIGANTFKQPPVAGQKFSVILIILMLEYIDLVCNCSNIS